MKLLGKGTNDAREILDRLGKFIPRDEGSRWLNEVAINILLGTPFGSGLACALNDMLGQPLIDDKRFLAMCGIGLHPLAVKRLKGGASGGGVFWLETCQCP